MRKVADLHKLVIKPGDDSMIKEMVNACNALIDQYEALDEPESDAGKELKVQILNYKNKIAKIKKGY
jgi:hypothetical protein